MRKPVCEQCLHFSAQKTCLEHVTIKLAIDYCFCPVIMFEEKGLDHTFALQAALYRLFVKKAVTWMSLIGFLIHRSNHLVYSHSQQVKLSFIGKDDVSHQHVL